MRATSSIRSASRCTSLSRQGGTRQPLVRAHSKPSRSRMPSTCPRRPRASPSSRSIRSRRSGTTRGCGRAAGRRRPCPAPGARRTARPSAARPAAARPIACSGWSCFSKRARRLGAQPERLRGPHDVRPDPGGRLHQHARGLVGDLGDLAAHDPGDARSAPRRRRPAPSRTSNARSTSSSVTIRSPSLARAHDDAPAAHLVEVERVQRLAGGEHHVVGDVDDVRDRALPGGHQPLLEPERRRARSSRPRTRAR